MNAVAELAVNRNDAGQISALLGRYGRKALTEIAYPTTLIPAALWLPSIKQLAQRLELIYGPVGP